MLKIPKELNYAICDFSRAEPFSKKPFQGYSSVFVALFPYSAHNSKGNISVYARGRDYHLWVKEALLRIAQDNISYFGEAIPFVDSWIFNEKALAAALGLGEIGKHSLLLNQELGSFTFIGGLLIKNPIKSSETKIQRVCTSCGSCIAACPTGALSESGFDSGLCLSSLTQKRKLSPQEVALLKKGALIWGCDLCQMACPVNSISQSKNLDKNYIPYLHKSDLDGLSEAAFKNKFGCHAFSWRGAELLRRNLDILESSI